VVDQTTPRIAPLEPPYAADVQADFDAVMRGAPPLTLFRVMARNQRTWQKFRAGGLLDKGALTLRQREIVIDRTCALNKCEYEWGVHVAIFAKAAELSDEQVKATVDGGASAPCWSTAEQALLRTVDALHYRATLSDDEFAALASHHSEAQIFEIFLLCGFYRTVSYLCNGLRLPLEQTAARFPH
jgi:alkylhydroperoxidase family enzyme